MHLVVSKSLSVEEAHKLVDHIENDIKEEFPRTSIITHIEPCDDGDQCNSCSSRCDRNV
jgi:divalent metal cation (Fe/Co/Zn/Cd) transporter